MSQLCFMNTVASFIVNSGTEFAPYQVRHEDTYSHITFIQIRDMSGSVWGGKQQIVDSKHVDMPQKSW